MPAIVAAAEGRPLHVHVSEQTKENADCMAAYGATPTQRFRHVLLPQLGPVIALLCVLRFIMTFNKFDDVYLLTGGGAGTDVVSVRVYQFLTARFDIGAASAQALVLAAGLIVLLIIYLRFLAPRVEEGED